MLRAASDSIYGCRIADFLDEVPDFEDDEIADVAQNQSEQKSNPRLQQEQLKPDFSSLQSIKEQISVCSRCALSKTRKNTVAGTGCRTPEVLVIGEGPGYEEDVQGKPFVGPAGQLLDKMLAAIQLSREINTFITNIVKCRPPANRIPYPEEAQACEAFLKAQISILKPKLILCVGSTASKNLLKTSVGVTKLRGQVYEYNAIPVCVTYHPSALLRDTSLKRPAWEDLKSLKKQLLKLAPDYEKPFFSSAQARLTQTSSAARADPEISRSKAQSPSK